MNSFSSALKISSVKDLHLIIKSHAEGLTKNQKLIACTLVKSSSIVSHTVFDIFLLGLGFVEAPDMNTPALATVREICMLGNSGGYQIELIDEKLAFLRVLGQLNDLHIAIKFVSEASNILNSISLEVNDRDVISGISRHDSRC